MSKRSAGFALSTVLSFGLLAQPTLNSGALSFSPGESEHASNCQYMDAGPSGPNQVWDFSAMTCGGVGSGTYVTMASTGYQATFPTATVASGDATIGYGFYRATDSTWEALGSTSSTNNPGYTYISYDSEIRQEYPFIYGSSYLDTIKTARLYNGVPVDTSVSTYSNTADGYGQVVFDFGAVSNVLRLHRIYHDVTTTDSLFDDASWIFIRPGTKTPILRLISVPGWAIYVAWRIDPNEVGVEELLRHDIGVDAMPNPASNLLQVTYSESRGHRLRLDLLDPNGQIMMTHVQPSIVDGIHREVIDVSMLDAGIYLIRVTDDNGATGMKRFLKL